MRRNVVSILLMATLVFTALIFNCSALVSGATGPWNGDWDTGNTGWGTITLVQTSPGSDVTGTFTMMEYRNKILDPQKGTIRGTVSGKILTGTYEYGPHHIISDFEVHLSPDGNRFEGAYYMGSKIGNPPYRAVGTRVGNAATAVPQPTKSDPNDSKARFSGMTGQVEILIPGAADWKLCKMDTVIPVGSHIRTQEDSSAILSFGDMSTFVLEQDSEIVVVTPPAKDSKIKMVAGNIWANVKRMVKEGSMEIEMNQAVAGIKGTTFICEVAKDGTSTLKVIEGTVEFTAKADGKSAMVNSGTLVSADKTGLGTPAPFDAAQETAQWDTVKAKAGSSSSSGNPSQTQKSPSGWVMVFGAVAVTFGLFKMNRR